MFNLTNAAIHGLWATKSLSLKPTAFVFQYVKKKTRHKS